jgi:hypothetical protein
MEGYGLTKSILAHDDGGDSLLPVPIDAAAVAETLPMGQAFQVVQLWATVHTAVTGSDAVITVSRVKSGDTKTDVGTFPIVAGVAGTHTIVSVNTDDDFYLAPGERLIFTSSGGATAGDCWLGAIGYEVPTGPNPVASFAAATKEPEGTGSVIYAAFTAS